MYEGNSTQAPNYYPTSPNNVTIDSKIAPADVPRISHEMAIIQKLLSEHSEIAGVVEQRLHAVLRPAAAQNANGGAVDPRSASSPMTCDLEGFRLQLWRLLEHYNDILNRLEV